MVTEHAPVDVPLILPTPTPEWSLADAESLGHAQGSLPLEGLVHGEDVAAVRVDADLMEIAGDLRPGKALDLGCGIGVDGLWLAAQGWHVTGIDRSSSAIAQAREAARRAGSRAVFEAADPADWRPASRYDLVYCTYALPARGMGRGRMLEMAVSAVAPGGTILLAELDVSLAREGWMAEKYLVSTDELERYLDGFRIHRSGVRMSRHRHGYEERVLPVAIVVATRRTDLRTI